MSYTLQSTFLKEETTENTTTNNNQTLLYCDQCKNPVPEWGIIHIQPLNRTKQITFLCSIKCKKLCIETNKRNEKLQIKLLKIYLKESKQKEKEQIKTSKSHVQSICEYCGNLINAFRSQRPRKYCSRNCFKEGKKHVCIGCGVKYSAGTYTNSKYCTRSCSIKNRNKIFRYDNHYYCDSCQKWILHKDSIMINKKPTCPKLNCNHNRLKTLSTRSKFNQKRNQVKWIE